MTYSSDHHNQSIRLKLCNTEAGIASVFLKSTNLLERDFQSIQISTIQHIAAQNEGPLLNNFRLFHKYCPFAPE